MVSDPRRERCPLAGDDALAGLDRVLQDADAPRWNWSLGDRLRADDLPALAAMREALDAPPPSRDRPPAALLRALAGARSAWLRERLAGIDDLVAAWPRLPCMRRDDLVRALADIVPDDVALDRLIVYGTSGSTGRPLDLPHHPAAVAQHFVLLERALALHGVRPRFTAGEVALWNVGAQASPAVFATPLAVWGGAMLLKLSLHPRHADRERLRRFAARHPPQVMTGDPAGFAELLAWDIDCAPLALVSSAAHLDAGLQAALAARYRCPIIDSYATTETGPVAVAHPDALGMVVLPPDIHVETVGDDGRPTPRGEAGEIVVSAARNPYLPLLRYRTGDHGRLVDAGDGTLRLVDLRARRCVVLRAADGAAVIAADVARIVHRHPVASFRCVQQVAGAIEIALRPLPGHTLDREELERELSLLIGRAAVIVDPTLGDDGLKVEPVSVG